VSRAVVEDFRTGDLVPVGHAYGPMEAAIAFSLLEAAGILVHVQNRHMASNAWGYMTALGGMAILVPTGQAAEARKCLAGFEPGQIKRWSLAMIVFSILASLALGTAVLPASGFFRLQRPGTSTSLQSNDLD
jgi:hypothetical protein